MRRGLRYAWRSLNPASDRPPPVFPDHEVLRLIGHGAYGEVWLARSMLGTLRAVKVVRRDAFENERPYERELRGITQFEPVSRAHEGLVDILQAGRAADGSCFYYVMELADDRTESGSGTRAGIEESYAPRTLASDLAAGRRPSPGECAETFRLLAEALQFLHSRGLVHRDIKPANIIFVQGQPKLADIGLVAPQDETRSWVGTDGYMPPEGPGTPAADLFSLGKVLYETATGRDRREFPELPADTLPADPVLALNPVWLRACAPQAADRYSSAAAMAADLACVARGESLPKTSRWSRRTALATLGAGAATAVAGIVLFRGHREPSPRAAVDYTAIPWQPPEPDAPVLADVPRHRYLTALASGIITVRDLLTHAELMRIDVPDENLPVARFIGLSPDGQWMALLGQDGTTRLRRVRADSGAYGTRRDPAAGEDAVAFNADHHRVAWADRANRVLCSDTRDFGAGRIKVELPGTIVHLAWHPDKDLLGAAVASPAEFVLVDPAAGAILERTPLPSLPRWMIWDLAGLLLACSDRVYEVSGKTATPLLDGHATAIARSADSKTVAVIRGTSVLVKHPDGLQELPQASIPRQISLSADGTLLACTGVTQRSLALFRRS